MDLQPYFMSELFAQVINSELYKYIVDYIIYSSDQN